MASHALLQIFALVTCVALRRRTNEGEKKKEKKKTTLLVFLPLVYVFLVFVLGLPYHFGTEPDVYQNQVHIMRGATNMSSRDSGSFGMDFSYLDASWPYKNCGFKPIGTNLLSANLPHKPEP